MAAGGSSRAIVAALLANLGIAIAKFVGFALTRASSMLAEAIHSLADSGNQGLLLLGGRRALREPTPQHPFGYGRERYFWAFVVSVVLFALGSLFALFEGFDKLRHPTSSRRRRSPRASWRSGSSWRPSASAPRSSRRATSRAVSRGGRSSATHAIPSCRSCCSRISVR